MLYSKLIITLLNFLDYFQQKKIINLINSKFSKPIIVFDIGAHYGETIKLFLKKLKIEKIYSFEASTQNFQVLKRKISKKNLDKVEIYNFGMGDKVSKSYINQSIESSSSTMNEVNEGSKYLKKKLQILNIRDKNVFYHKIPIQVITLDSFIDKESQKYKDSDQFKQWVKGQPQQLEQFRMIALEQQLIENLEKALKSKDKVIEFSELANK